MTEQPLRVAVLMGGPSPEHAVSLATGSVIVNTLDRERFRLRPFVIESDFGWVTPPGDLEEFPFDPASLGGVEPLRLGPALEILREYDVAFVALHGTFGEDGTVQGLLEFLGIPYTGSSVAGSALAMDKVRSKEAFEFHCIPTPPFRELREDAWRDDRDALVDSVRAALGEELVVKSPNLGSSFGVYMVADRQELVEAVEKAMIPDGRALIEPRLAGREVTCAVLGGMPGEGPQALPPTEIIPPEGRYFDYETKYAPGMTEEVTPPRMEDEVIAHIQATALKVHRTLELGGMSRSDMLVLPDGSLTVFEVNTIPGMTASSLYPQAARAMGMDFPTLLGRLVELAVASFEDRRRRFADPRSDQAARPSFPGRPGDGA